MTDRPILFSGPMVQAILSGKKVQTRRIIKPQPQLSPNGAWWHWPRCGGIASWPADRRPIPDAFMTEELFERSPWQVGTRLWVRETFAIETNRGIDDYPPPFNDGRPILWTDDEDGHWWQQCHYRATDPTPELAYPDLDEPAVRWRPSIHMPRWASRLTLEITDVRVERVQDISEADICAELGAPVAWPGPGPEPYKRDLMTCWANVWESVNGKGAWERNDFVWCISFRRI